MSRWIMAALAVIVAPGCTTLSLERHTLNQALSISDLRYKEVLDNLTALAANPGALPSFGVVASGTANVSNTGQVETITLWDHAIKGFSKQTLSFMGKHNPDQQWTVNPVVSEPQLAALKFACLWVLHGPPEEGSEAMSLLRGARLGETTGYHFDVACRLAAIEPGWLHVGRLRDMPSDTCYVAHCGKTFVWVSRSGMEGLSAFTLVILDIATVYPPSLVLVQPVATVKTVTPDKKAAGTRKDGAIAPVEPNPADGAQLSVTTPEPAQQDIVWVAGKPTPGPIKVGRPAMTVIPSVDLGVVPKQPPAPIPQMPAFSLPALVPSLVPPR